VKLSYLIVALAFVISGAVTVRAHDAGLSTAQIEVTAFSIELTTSFAPSDAGELLVSARHAGKLTSQEFESVRPQLEAVAPSLWQVTQNGQTLLPKGGTRRNGRRG
jgi:hypothetical protein